MAPVIVARRFLTGQLPVVEGAASVEQRMSAAVRWYNPAVEVATWIERHMAAATRWYFPAAEVATWIA